MLKRIALLAPFALIVAAAACGGESPSTTGEEEQGTPQASSADEALTSSGEGVTDEPTETSESELRVGGARAVRVGGVRGGVGGARWGGVAVGGGRVGGVRVGGVRRGWVNGRWAPGWGWSRGVWVAGGTGQFSCVNDLDCVTPLGRGVAVCDFEPTIGLGQCVAPGWF